MTDTELAETIARVKEGVQQHWWQPTVPVARDDLTRLLNAADRIEALQSAQAWRPIETKEKPDASED